LPAALVITRIISLPGKTKICIDMGHKSIAAENDLNNRAVFLNAPDIKPVSQSEEHMVAEVSENHNYKIGDVLYVLPVHICPTTALYERSLVIENGSVITEWQIAARDRKIFI
jgi:D-serine deaminase-like pyridoxal phosphate-dependent protein